MHGNVLEWCEDPAHSTYTGAPADGSTWVEGGSSNRIARGGSWYLVPNLLRSATRFDYWPAYVFDDMGFRLVRE